MFDLADEGSTRRRHRVRIALAVVLVPLALYVAAGVWALSGFYRSNGEITVTSRCPSTIYVEVAGKIGSDGFTLDPGDHVTVERPHTSEILVWLGTPVDNSNVTRLPIPRRGEDLTITGTSCPV